MTVTSLIPCDRVRMSAADVLEYANTIKARVQEITDTDRSSDPVRDPAGMIIVVMDEAVSEPMFDFGLVEVPLSEL